MAEPSEMIGEECGLCHQEAFRLVERMAYVPVKCCLRCAARLDNEAESKTVQEALKAMDKAERKKALSERSRDWARSWHGKQVLVTYDVDDGYGNLVKENCHIRGMAYYGSLHEDIGWGRVKVVLDKSELHRFSFIENDSRYSDRPWPVIDGFKWGLGNDLLRRGYEGELVQPLCFHINWGDHNKYFLEKWSPEAEMLARKRLEEKQEREALEGIEWLSKLCQGSSV
jgi:hypothetical protein